MLWVVSQSPACLPALPACARARSGRLCAHCCAAALPPCAPAHPGDEDEWRDWRAVGDPVLHIELRRWADALVLAPLSANTLAKLAHGLCDNLLTCVVRRAAVPPLPVPSAPARHAPHARPPTHSHSHPLAIPRHEGLGTGANPCCWRPP